MRKPIIGVMGPGNDALQVDIDRAFELGKLIAKQGWILLSGGRKQEVMNAVSQGAKSAGGLTIGIIPEQTITILPRLLILQLSLVWEVLAII